MTEASAGTNLGTATTVQVDAGSGEQKVGYIRFTINGLSGSPKSAKIQLYVRSGTVDGPTVQLASNSWGESTVDVEESSSPRPARESTTRARSIRGCGSSTTCRH